MNIQLLTLSCLTFIGSSAVAGDKQKTSKMVPVSYARKGKSLVSQWFPYTVTIDPTKYDGFPKESLSARHKVLEKRSIYPQIGVRACVGLIAFVVGSVLAKATDTKFKNGDKSMQNYGANALGTLVFWGSLPLLWSCARDGIWDLPKDKEHSPEWVIKMGAAKEGVGFEVKTNL